MNILPIAILSLLLSPGDAPAPAKNPAEWSQKRTQILERWQEIIGPFPNREPLNVTVLGTEQLGDHTRVHVSYKPDAISATEAYLLIPDPEKFKGKRPGAVVLHQTSATHIKDPVGLNGRESVHIALHLVRRGYVCIAPRNFLWATAGKSYLAAADELLKKGLYKTGMAKMTFDAIRAVDVLAQRPEVDPTRLCCIGHSLGGKEALYLAAFDTRIRAAVSCEGGIGLSFSNWEADWYLGKQIRAPGFRHDNDEVVALIAPRAFLLIGGESADGEKSWPYIATNLPLWRLFGAETKIGLLRHKFGHDFPLPGEDRERVYQWLDHWMKPADSGLSEGAAPP